MIAEDQKPILVKNSDEGLIINKISTIIFWKTGC